jgi:outer membrane receptor protein involved in Fe transport
MRAKEHRGRSRRLGCIVALLGLLSPCATPLAAWAQPAGDPPLTVPPQPLPPNLRPAREAPGPLSEASQDPTTGAPQPLPPPPPPDAPPLRDDLSEVSVLSLEELLNQKLETATKTPTPILQIPNRVEVVTDEQIRRRGYRYLIELLEDLPGLQTMNYVEAETGAHVIVRGIWQNNKILVLYNGHKITSPEGKDFIFGRHNWSLANVKRVEFIYGPASALYGADAVSAVINIVPKDWRDLTGHVVEATAGYGLYNTVEADLATGFGFNALRVRVDGAFHRSDGPNFLKDYGDYYASLRTPLYVQQEGQVDGSGNPVWVAPSISYHVSLLANLGENIRLHYLRIYSEEQSAMGFTPPLFEFSKENKWAWYQDNAGLTHELVLDDGLVLRTLLTYNHQECDPKTQFINNFFDGGVKYTREDYKMFRSIRLGAAEELVHTSSPLGHKLQLVLGLRFEDIYSLTKMSTVTGLPVDLRYPVNYQNNPAVPNGEVNFQALGGYFQAQYEAFDRLNVVAGVNVDKVWYYKPAFNPRVGVTFSAAEVLTLRASAARAYLVPAPAYQFEGFNNKTFPNMGSIGAIPNTDLVPEDYLTLELGLASVLLQKRLLIDLSAFHTANDNYLLRQRKLNAMEGVRYTPDFPKLDGLRIPIGAAIFTSENGGEVRAYGGEVALTADIGEWLRPWASYSLALGRQTETPTRTGVGSNTSYLANQAAHQIKGGFQLQPLRGLFLTPTAVWYSRTKMRTDVADPALLSQGLDPFFLLNLSAVWEADHFQLWARVQNLLDRHYYRPGGPVSQQAAPRVPQAGILGQAGIRVLY